jgi:hypothetical protein
VGHLSLASLKISTHALESTSAGDATYTSLENQLASFTTQRNAIASHIISLLERAEFKGQHIDEDQAQAMIDQSQSLMSQVDAVAA